MKLIAFFITLIVFSVAPHNFKSEQKRYSRVRNAYSEKEHVILDLLSSKSIEINTLEIYIRAFKNGKKLQLWGKNNSDTRYQLIKEYKVCATCGKLGPKRKQGDMQIPEGFYHIDRFNPASNFHLSLGINYPNHSDRILGEKGNLGGDIFIHGDCVTIGCLPITNDQIKELYLFCIEAKNNGQSKIPVHIFPSVLSDKNMKVLTQKYSDDLDKINLWKSLKEAYDLFNKNKTVPKIQFLKDGRHLVSD